MKPAALPDEGSAISHVVIPCCQYRQRLSKACGMLSSEQTMPESLVNIGKLHAVKCEWCGLKMSCNCWDGNNPEREGHILVLCPRCQVTDLINMIFGEKMLREILVSKIEQAKRENTVSSDGKPPRLTIVSRRTTKISPEEGTPC
jgi:hypothetical protein